MEIVRRWQAPYELRDPTGENKDNFYWSLNASLNIANSNIRETRLYWHKPHVLEKSVGQDIWALSWQSGLFLAFFQI